jgi:hypothetical protein
MLISCSSCSPSAVLLLLLRVRTTHTSPHAHHALDPTHYGIEPRDFTVIAPSETHRLTPSTIDGSPGPSGPTGGSWPRTTLGLSTHLSRRDRTAARLDPCRDRFVAHIHMFSVCLSPSRSSGTAARRRRSIVMLAALRMRTTRSNTRASACLSTHTTAPSNATLAWPPSAQPPSLQTSPTRTHSVPRGWPSHTRLWMTFVRCSTPFQPTQPSATLR